MTDRWWVPRYRVVRGHYETDSYSLQQWRWWWPFWSHVSFSFADSIDDAKAKAPSRRKVPQITIVSAEFR